MKKNEPESSGRLLPRETPKAYTSGTVATESIAESTVTAGGVGTITLKRMTNAATQESPNPRAAQVAQHDRSGDVHVLRGGDAEGAQDLEAETGIQLLFRGERSDGTSARRRTERRRPTACPEANAADRRAASRGLRG